MSKLYFVRAAFGSLGEAWVERNPEDMTRQETMRDLRAGQWDDVRQVVEVDLIAGTARSVPVDSLIDG